MVGGVAPAAKEAHGAAAIGLDGLVGERLAASRIATAPIPASRTAPMAMLARRIRAGGPVTGSADTGATANKAIGSAMPLSRGDPRGTKRTDILVRVSDRTVSVTRSSPGRAWAQTRAAMFTARPTGPSPPSVVSPAWTPTPTWIGWPGMRAVASIAAALIARPPSMALDADGKTM